MSKIMHAEIDYGYGKAEIWGEFDADTVERFFTRHANQCFGIRKSIAQVDVLFIGQGEIPSPWGLLPGAAAVLKHSGDTVVWNAAGEKIKSEFD